MNRKLLLKPFFRKRPKLIVFFLFPLLLSTFFCQAQNSSATQFIQGKVVDKDGLPVSGVSVQIKGTTNGVASDENGNFKIPVKVSSATIVFSIVGYEKQEKTLPAGSVTTITLTSTSSALQDVVVIGYSTTKRVNLTGAVSVINKDVIENRPVTNAIAALQGAAPGLIITRNNGQPGQEGYNVNIRGFASLNGTNNPLVIIDGVEGDLSILNPNDIENISILKDAAAASIYGAKAAGGVILVTTKKGSTKGKPTVVFTSLNSIKKKYALPEVLHSYEQAAMMNIAQANAGVNQSWSKQQIKWMMDPDTNVVNGQPYYDIDVSKLVLRKQTMSNNQNLTVSGGNDKNQYLVGLGFFTQQGVFIVGPDGYSRFNGRLNTTTKFNSKFTFDSRIAYTYSGIKAPSASVNGDNGLIYNIYTLRTIYPIWTDGTNNTKYSSLFSQNDYALLKDGGYNQTMQHNVNGVFTLSGTLSDHLSARLVYSPSFFQGSNNIFIRSIPQYSTATTTTPTSYFNPTNSYAEARTTQYSQNAQALLDYDMVLRKNHHFHLLGGAEYKYYNFDANSIKVAGLISNDIPSINLYSANATYTLSDNIQTNVWYSGFGRLTYNYKSVYLAEANLRYDASSRLAPGHQGQLFPSFSVGYNISNDTWFPKNNFLSELKLRASWGNLGNAQLGALNTNNYNYIAQLVSAGNYPFNNVINPSYYQNALPSQGLGWETVRTSNIGLDIGLFDNRLTGSFDYFVRNNNNMLINVNFPAVLGVTPPTTNGASMRTTGWELSIAWKDKIGKDFSYFFNANIADNQNKITRYNGQNTVSEGLNTAIQGYPINSIFGFVDQGYFTSAADVAAGPFLDARNAAGDIKYKDMNGDNKVTVGSNTIEDHGDLVYLGNTSPRYQFGFTIGFQWKGIDLSTFFQGVGKRALLLNPYALVPFSQSWRQPWAVQQDYWTPANPNAKFPRLYWYNSSSSTNVFNGRVSTHWIQNAAYLELKNLQIGYSLPQKLIRRLKVQKVRIFFTGEDLWQINKMWFPYFNPESTQNNAGWNYPFFHTYSAGLNVTF